MRRPRTGRGLAPPGTRVRGPDPGGPGRTARAGPPGPSAPASQSHSDLVGAARARAFAPKGEGCHPRSCHPVPQPLPPGRDVEGSRWESEPARVRALRSVRGGGGRPFSCTAARSDAGTAGEGGEGDRGVWSWSGTGTGVQRSPVPHTEVSWAAAVTASGGTWDKLAARSGGGPGGGGAGPGPGPRGARTRSLPPVSLSKQALPEPRQEPLPAPVRSPGAAAAQSRVCLARERCAWLHNSPDGIRPGVFLNRAAKSASSPWAAPRGPLLLEGQAETRGPAALSGVTWRPRAERPSPPRGRGEAWVRVWNRLVWTLGAPKLLPLPPCSSGLEECVQKSGQNFLWERGLASAFFWRTPRTWVHLISRWGRECSLLGPDLFLPVLVFLQQHVKGPCCS